MSELLRHCHLSDWNRIYKIRQRKFRQGYAKKSKWGCKMVQCLWSEIGISSKISYTFLKYSTANMWRYIHCDLICYSRSLEQPKCFWTENWLNSISTKWSTIQLSKEIPISKYDGVGVGKLPISTENNAKKMDIIEMNLFEIFREPLLQPGGEEVKISEWGNLRNKPDILKAAFLLLALVILSIEKEAESFVRVGTQRGREAAELLTVFWVWGALEVDFQSSQTQETKVPENKGGAEVSLTFDDVLFEALDDS